LKSSDEKFIHYRLGSSGLKKVNQLPQQNLYKESEAKLCHIEIEKDLEDEGEDEKKIPELIVESVRHVKGKNIS